MSPLTTSSVSAGVLITGALYAFEQAHSPQAKRRRLRQMLPQDLSTWRLPPYIPPKSPDTLDEELYGQAWAALQDIFLEQGIRLWPYRGIYYRRTPNNMDPLSSGYAYIGGHRTDPTDPGTISDLRFFPTTNPNNRIARTRDGHDVVIRIIVIHNEGHDHLRILRKLATGVNSLFFNNQSLPMLAEFHFEDIIFGIFPRVGSDMSYLYGFWARNSAGDIVEVIMQMLEALAYIHKLNIAHRDAFKDNFVIQWHPESFKTMSISPSRPRVYLIDFEVAVEFPPECPGEERLVTGYPVGGSFPEVEKYRRPCAPELAIGTPYSPFKLDIWQLAQSVLDVRSTIPEIDKVLDDMYNMDPDKRPTAQEALESIQAVVNSIPPKALLITPWMKNDWLTQMLAEQQWQAANK